MREGRMTDSLDPETLRTVGLAVGLGSAALSAALVAAILCCRHRCPRQKLSETRRGEKTKKNDLGFGPEYDNTGYSAGPGDGDKTDVSKNVNETGSASKGSTNKDKHSHEETGDKGKFYYSESNEQDFQAMSTVRLHRGDMPTDIPSMERQASDVASSGTDDVTSVERRLTFPPVLMIPFRSTLLSGRALQQARPSTIAGLPSSRETADWASGTGAGSLYHGSSPTSPSSPTTVSSSSSGRGIGNYTTAADDILQAFSQSGSCRR